MLKVGGVSDTKRVSSQYPVPGQTCSSSGPHHYPDSGGRISEASRTKGSRATGVGSNVLVSLCVRKGEVSVVEVLVSQEHPRRVTERTKKGQS